MFDLQVFELTADEARLLRAALDASDLTNAEGERDPIEDALYDRLLDFEAAVRGAV